jgi:hypothetical protein
MASDRFDDVSFEILEGPEPGPRRRRGVVALAAVIAAGALAGGAGAHTDGPAAGAQRQSKSVSSKRDGHGCKHGERHQGLRDSSVRY